jgi:hypothetical protein
VHRFLSLADPAGWIDLMPTDSSMPRGKQSPDSQWRIDPDTKYVICNWDNPRYNSGIYVPITQTPASGARPTPVQAAARGYSAIRLWAL